MSAQTSQASSPATDASTARFVLPAEGFALAGLFERVPEISVECEPAIATPDNHALLVVQTDNCESAVATALQTDPTVGAVERFGERIDGVAYRVTWEGHPRRLIQRFVGANITLVSARGRGSEWRLRLLAPSRERISRAHEIMNNLDCGDDCRDISSLDGGSSTHSRLSDKQREALVAAFERGYYNIPQDVTADEVATKLEVSHQALSERLKRGCRHLIETELIATDEKYQ